MTAFIATQIIPNTNNSTSDYSLMECQTGRRVLNMCNSLKQECQEQGDDRDPMLLVTLKRVQTDFAYSMVFHEVLCELHAKYKFTGTELVLLHKLSSLMDFGNKIPSDRIVKAKIARSLNVSRVSVQKAFDRLLDIGLIVQTEDGDYFLDPNCAYKGRLIGQKAQSKSFKSQDQIKQILDKLKQDKLNAKQAYNAKPKKTKPSDSLDELLEVVDDFTSVSDLLEKRKEDTSQATPIADSYQDLVAETLNINPDNHDLVLVEQSSKLPISRPLPQDMLIDDIPF